MNERSYLLQQLETIRQANETARMRILMAPGKGYRVGFWRRMARRVVRALT